MLNLLRIHHYIKNLFIFAPLFFTFTFSLTFFIKIIVAFILFSLIASSIYVFNDLMDIEEDKCHPVKKYRPLACGKVSKINAKIIFIVLSGFTLTTSFVFNIHFFLFLTIYYILNIGYSLGLKHIPIIDIFTIATGFVLRLFAGSSVIGVSLSMWIITITFLLALFLALAKRRADFLLAIQGKKTRKNIDGYNLEFTNTAMAMMSGIIVVGYLLYTISDSVMLRLGTQSLYITTFFVLLGIMRYMQISFVEKNAGNPTRILLKDRFLQLTILGWIISFILIIKLA